MNSNKPDILLLALGNELLGDDGVALLAARKLRTLFSEEQIDIIESSESGLALMEMLSGYSKALLIDSVQTKTHPIGDVIEFSQKDFRKVIAPSPHYAGLPEILATAERLQIDFPKEIRVLGMEVENPFDFQEELTPSVKQGLPQLIEAARSILWDWTCQYRQP